MISLLFRICVKACAPLIRKKKRIWNPFKPLKWITNPKGPSVRIIPHTGHFINPDEQTYTALSDLC
jgi:hypothetical protein